MAATYGLYGSSAVRLAIHAPEMPSVTNSSGTTQQADARVAPISAPPATQRGIGAPSPGAGADGVDLDIGGTDKITPFYNPNRRIRSVGTTGSRGFFNVMQPGLLRAQLSALTGCNLETIRYYEKVGLLPPPPRSANGYRVYPPDLVKRLQFILRARNLGFSMEEIRSLLSLTDQGTQTCGEVKAKTEKHLADTRRRIVDLRRMERILATTVRACSGGAVPECAVLDALGRA